MYAPYGTSVTAIVPQKPRFDDDTNLSKPSFKNYTNLSIDFLPDPNHATTAGKSPSVDMAVSTARNMISVSSLWWLLTESRDEL